MPGLVPRGLVRLFDIIDQSKAIFKVELSCYMVEIYLSELRDLLLPKGQPAKELDIKEDKDGRIRINNVTRKEAKEIRSLEALEAIFMEGLKHRKVR